MCRKSPHTALFIGRSLIITSTPAAADTLKRYFTECGSSPSDFDLIITGDLGSEGYEILKDLMRIENIALGDKYTDCGMLLYNADQDVHSGGSGCGCSAVVLATFIAEQFRTGNVCEVLFIGTGALMSPLSLFQGESIPGIAHLIRLSAERKN